MADPNPPGGAPPGGIVDQTNNIGTSDCTVPATPADTVKDPCKEKLHVDSLVKNAIIKAQDSLINKKSTTYEYGASHNLASWPNGSYLNTPVTTQNLTNGFTPTFNWDPNNGYTIGFSHGHPAGTGPDYLDVIPMISNLSNANLQAAGNAAIQYYKSNVSSTIISSAGNFVITVNNWIALQTINSTNSLATLNVTFNKYIQNYETNNVDATPAEAYEYALLETFGNGINLYAASTGSTNYNAMTLSTDLNNNVVISIKTCP